MVSKLPKVKPPADDLFNQIDDLFRNKTPVGKVPIWTLHRFLASDRDFAVVAKSLQGFWDDDMTAEIWRSSLPTSPRAPRLKYVGPKKPSAPDTLIKKVADVEGWNYKETEENLLLLYSINPKFSKEILDFYGVE